MLLGEAFVFRPRLALLSRAPVADPILAAFDWCDVFDAIVFVGYLGVADAFYTFICCYY